MTTILVTRNDDKFSSALREARFDVVNLELIETKPLLDKSELRGKLARLRDYDGVFFTSPVAAEIFVKERNGSNGFYGAIYALGRRAQNVLVSAGLEVRSAAAANTAEEMLDRFGNDEFAGKRYLFVRGEKSLRTIPEKLSDIASVDEVAVYKTEPAIVDEKTIESLISQFEQSQFDVVCFFSPSGVGRFAELFSEAAHSVKAAAIGTTTANAASEAGLEVVFVSPRSNADDFARGLIEHIKH
jgi:uroporphyrinogen-III synthase